VASNLAYGKGRLSIVEPLLPDGAMALLLTFGAPNAMAT
jgi:hypothetical protein